MKQLTIIPLLFLISCLPPTGSAVAGNSSNNVGSTKVTPKPAPADANTGTAVSAGNACGGKQGLQCATGLFCEMTEADGLSCDVAERMGTCMAKPDACTMDLRPVCGCDGKTYNNDCARQNAGVTRAKLGACDGDEVSGPIPLGKKAKEGETCGGIAGIQCGETLTCNMSEVDGTSCNTADRAGKCVKTPEVCTRDFRPVCGCDGKTYSNDCQRLSVGATRAKLGACDAQ